MNHTHQIPDGFTGLVTPPHAHPHKNVLLLNPANVAFYPREKKALFVV